MRAAVGIDVAAVKNSVDKHNVLSSDDDSDGDDDDGTGACNREHRRQRQLQRQLDRVVKKLSRIDRDGVTDDDIRKDCDGLKERREQLELDLTSIDCYLGLDSDTCAADDNEDSSILEQEYKFHQQQTEVFGASTEGHLLDDDDLRGLGLDFNADVMLCENAGNSLNRMLAALIHKLCDTIGNVVTSLRRRLDSSAGTHTGEFQPASLRLLESDKYLGSIMTRNGAAHAEVSARGQKAYASFYKLSSIWKAGAFS